MSNQRALIFLANDTRFNVTIGNPDSMTAAWRQLFTAAGDPTVPAGEVMAAAKKLASYYGEGQANIPRVHIRHIQGKIDARNEEKHDSSRTSLATVAEVVPALPDIYKGKPNDVYYDGPYALPKTLIPALNMDFGTPHLLPPVIHYDKTVQAITPYSARARSLRPLPTFGNAIGGMGALVGLFPFHSLPLLLTGVAVMIPSTVIALWGLDNKHDYNLGENWVRYWGANHKLRHWLKIHWNIETKDVTRLSDFERIYSIVQLGMAGSLQVVATNGKTYTLERATTHGRITIMDHGAITLPTPTSATPADPSHVEPVREQVIVDPLSQATRDRINEALALRGTLSTHPDLSIEQRHVLDRAVEIIAEAEQLATTLQRLPEMERVTIFAALERSIGVAISDIKQVEQAHLQAAVRQAKILDRYTQGLAN